MEGGAWWQFLYRKATAPWAGEEVGLLGSTTSRGAAWGASLRFDTVEEFWSLYDQRVKPSRISENAEFHLFRAGIEPKWEDPECSKGGKWTVMRSQKDNHDTIWLETLMALIGEQFVEADEDKLTLWTKTATNEAVQNGDEKVVRFMEYEDIAFHRRASDIIDVTEKISE